MSVVEGEHRFNLERQAEAARRSSRLKCPKPRSEVSPKQWALGSTMPSWRSGKTHGFASQEGIRRLLRSQPRRFGFGLPLRARPRRGCANITWGSQRTLKTGTFYLARKRNFLLGSDTISGTVIAEE